MPGLPSFLEPLDKPDTANLPYENAIFRHAPLGPVHALWWPCKQIDTIPNVVLLFIPGNPGLLSFYPPFLTAVWDKVSSSARLAIFAHAHVGHTPGIDDRSEWNPQRYGLTTQIQNAVEAFDSVKLAFGPTIKIILIGHSIGAWVALQVLKARPEAVDGLFLLFPTISHMRSTPNGRALSCIFQPPIPRIISVMSSIARIPPALLSWFFWSWPRAQIMVLHSLLSSPSSILAVLTMGHEEMVNIRDLDTALLDEHKDRIWLYYAEKDGWVGNQKEAVLRAIDAYPGYVRVVHGHRDIPHAFCINHGEQLAAQCYEWLAGRFI